MTTSQHKVSSFQPGFFLGGGEVGEGNTKRNFYIKKATLRSGHKNDFFPREIEAAAKNGRARKVNIS